MDSTVRMRKAATVGLGGTVHIVEPVTPQNHPRADEVTGRGKDRRTLCGIYRNRRQIRLTTSDVGCCRCLQLHDGPPLTWREEARERIGTVLSPGTAFRHPDNGGEDE